MRPDPVETSNGRATLELLLQRSPSALSCLLDAAGGLVLLLDRRGRVVFFSRGCEAATGWTAAAITGRPVWEFLWTAEQVAAAEERFAGTLTEGVSPVTEVRWRTADGGERRIRWANTVLTDSEGSPAFVLATGQDMTEHRSTQEALGRSEANFRTLLDGLPDAVAVYRAGRVLYANAALREMTRLPPDKTLVGQPVLAFVHPKDHDRVIARMHAVEERRESAPTIEERLIRLDGTEIVAEVSAIPVQFDGVAAALVVIRDITDRHLHQDALRGSEERYALAARSANSGLWDFNFQTGRLFLSSRFHQLLGYEDGELLPDDYAALRELVHSSDLRATQDAIEAHLDARTPRFEVESRVRHRSGQWRWYQIRGMAALGESGLPYRVAGSITDITDQKEAERQLLRDALYDRLTGLPNRALFLDRLRRCLERELVGGHRCFAVLFLDVDRFKVLNDSLGHLFGDEVLVEIARRLERCVRLQDTVARFGGDEFTLLLDRVQHARDATRIAQRVHQQLAQPVRVQGREVFITVSMGIAFDEGTYLTPEEVLRDADNAMYRAKASGRAQSVIFDRKMHAAALHMLELEADMYRAVEREEFVVHYQPIVALSSGQIAGFEALVRWQHPSRGLVGPGEFIPFAEETGLIVPIGLWVLERACRELLAMEGQVPGTDMLTLAVNLSGRQLQHPDLLERVGEILTEVGFPAHRLKLEMTESSLMGDPGLAAAALGRLRAKEICLCIDDFGTGYSSLSHLRQFPIDTLKIDRSFVATMDAAGGGDTALARSILALAHELGKDAVAEGVETAGQLLALRALQCDFAQGYLFSRGLPAAEAVALLAEDPRW